MCPTHNKTSCSNVAHTVGNGMGRVSRSDFDQLVNNGPGDCDITTGSSTTSTK